MAFGDGIQYVHDFSRLSFLKRSTRCTVGMRMRQYVNVYLDDLAQPEEGQQITAEMFHAKGNAVRTAPTAGGTHSGNRTGSGKDFVAPRTLRWFTRGWTLQELIASSHVKFYCKTEKSIGALSDLVLPVSQVTGIHVSLLKHQRLLASFSIAQRMNWASKRVTTRVEDRAYSLLGIFNVNMPVIYGEGAKAFQRLQEEILRAYSDHTIFAWRPSGPEETRSYRQDLLASSPADFHHPSFKCLRKTPRGSSQREYEITARNVTFDLPVLDVPVARRGSKSHPTHTVAMLNCGHEDRLTSHITLVLYKNSTGDYSRASLHECDIYDAGLLYTRRRIVVARSCREVELQGHGSDTPQPGSASLLRCKGSITLEIADAEGEVTDSALACGTSWDGVSKCIHMPHHYNAEIKSALTTGGTCLQSSADLSQFN